MEEEEEEGGKEAGNGRKGRREESIGRITASRWNIPDYVSAGQILPCGRAVMRQQDIGLEKSFFFFFFWCERPSKLSLFYVLVFYFKINM